MKIQSQNKAKASILSVFKEMRPFIIGEKRRLYQSFILVLANIGITMLFPFLIGHAIDIYIQKRQENKLFAMSVALLFLSFLSAGIEYFYAKWIGGIGQRTLFKLRNEIFNKLQTLPVAFFNQHKNGDIISRINSDTEQVNQFFSQSLVQFATGILTIIAAGTFLLYIDMKLGAATVLPSLLIGVFVLLVAPYARRKNAASRENAGLLSAEIHESLQHFKTIISFNRRDYFRGRFDKVNNDNFNSALIAGVVNNLFAPIFGILGQTAQLIVLVYGIYLTIQGALTIGLLISFISYTQSFYTPLRQLATLWAGFQTALAAWDRIAMILRSPSTKQIISTDEPKKSGHGCNAEPVLEFQDVAFSYSGGKSVLQQVNFKLQEGRAYAFVGPTGGGKTTIALLMASLYEPTNGAVRLFGRDIALYSEKERTDLIGCILQDPVLFSGTIKDNILYGNDKFRNYTSENLMLLFKEAGFEKLLEHFDEGFDTCVNAHGEDISLGQKQLIAFMRAILRKPRLLILDEATANVDIVTEKLLRDLVDHLPERTTKVIIAHRLNTIKNVDHIFFVNAGNLIVQDSFDKVIGLFREHDRLS